MGSQVIAAETWSHSRDGDSYALAQFQRHYSYRAYADGRRRTLFVGPGEKMVLVATDALFVWRKFIDNSGQQGVNCAVFRNEGPVRSSDLIRAAMGEAWVRWPGARLYTYVKASAIRSTNPGYCFLMAGWRREGRTKGGLAILATMPELTAVPGQIGA